MPHRDPEKYEQLRDAILTAIKTGVSLGHKVYSADLAREFQCSDAHVCRIRADLIDQGALPCAADAMKNNTNTTEESIRARIAAVHNAKVAKLPYRRPRLTMRQLKRVLP